MLLHYVKLSGTPSSGDYTTNAPSIVGLCHEILVHPLTDTTTYDITITNPDGLIIYQRLSETGDVAELLQLPMIGVHTVTLANATADELFQIYLAIREK